MDYKAGRSGIKWKNKKHRQTDSLGKDLSKDIQEKEEYLKSKRNMWRERRGGRNKDYQPRRRNPDDKMVVEAP